MNELTLGHLLHILLKFFAFYKDFALVMLLCMRILCCVPNLVHYFASTV